MIDVRLTAAEAAAVLRGLDRLTAEHSLRNRRERPGDLRHEGTAEMKLRAALARHDNKEGATNHG